MGSREKCSTACETLKEVRAERRVIGQSRRSLNLSGAAAPGQAATHDVTTSQSYSRNRSFLKLYEIQ